MISNSITSVLDKAETNVYLKLEFRTVENDLTRSKTA